ncbi:hypothetical protein MMC20_006310 [Loxospora ochrophaea]|nr:hypothetical protein [Loxospora ochrophaea]
MESSAAAEALIPRFQLDKLLNQSQGGRNVVLLGTIDSKSALLLLERAAFPSDLSVLQVLHASLTNVANLGANDIYAWYLASSTLPRSSSSAAEPLPPDLKINLIYPCTDTHIKKYSPQTIRMVTETSEMYKSHVRPYMQRKREEGRLNWVFNIIEGRSEQEDVILRLPSSGEEEEGFLILPDMNWDRKTMSSLRLLCLVERRDIWSLRDLSKRHVNWLKNMRAKILIAVGDLYPNIESDMLKLYIHYQPTYYHFHIHIVHTSLDPNSTQAVGKAFGLENTISQLANLTEPNAGMADFDLTYSMGEASELWTEVFLPLKRTQGNETI